MNNRVQLITYPNSLGGDLKALSRVLPQYFPGVFGGIHILPPFPSTGDRGFAPVSYREIDACFGGWEDIRTLSLTYDVLLDFMVNHISRHSVYFQDFVKLGRASEYTDLFITLDKIWPGGNVVEDDIKKIFLRRPKTPFLNVKIEKDGSLETIWATFGQAEWSEQIDIDVQSRVGRKFIIDTLNYLAGRGVNTLRLDAAAFVIKKAGTSCFLVEPQISEFFSWIHEQANLTGIHLLLEIHTSPEIQAELSSRGYWVYNFVLPALILHTLINGSSAALKSHLSAVPRQQITMLDCHDGIPVQPDLDGVLDIASMERVVKLCEDRGANISRIYSGEHRGQGGFDAHQINCTYYSALGRDDDAYILARAIQFFVPGTPQVYYVGLLAGQNSPNEVVLQGDQRAINRHNYSEGEIKAALNQRVVQRLLRLIRFRNESPAFAGEFHLMDCSDGELVLSWEGEQGAAKLSVDLSAKKCQVSYMGENGRWLEFTP